MKNKKMIRIIKWGWIAILFFVIMISLSYIAHGTDYSRIGNYTLADWGGAPSVDGTNATEGSSIETKGYTVANGAATYQSAFNISYYQPFSLTTGDTGDQKWHYNGAINYNLCCNMVAKDENDASLYHVFGFIESNDDFHGAFVQSNNADWVFAWNAGGNTQTFTGYNPSNDWANFTVCYQPSTQWAIKFTNGSWFNTTTNVDASLPDTFGVISINTGRTIIGMWACWNGTYEKNPSFNFAPDTIAPIVNITYPSNNSYINKNFYILGNSSPDTIKVECNNSLFNINYGTNISFNMSNISGTFADGFYQVNCSASDLAGNVGWAIANFTIDTTLPTISILSPANEQVFTNDSVIFSFICTDLNLFGFDSHTWNSSGYIDNNATRNLTSSPYTALLEIDLTKYGDGFYNFTGDCMDGHTGSLVSDYDISKTSGSISIGNFRFESLDKVPLTITDSKLSDRYTYDFNMETDGSYRFKVYSKEKLYYLPWSRYKGHFISGNNWLDTEPYAPVDIIRQDDNNYIITLKGSDFRFSSIGDLNNMSFARNFAVKRILSTAYLYSPLNSSVYTNITQLGTVNFTYSVSSVPLTVFDCVINISGIYNISYDATNGNRSILLNLSTLSNDLYSFRVDCRDKFYSTYINYSSKYQQFRVNITAPEPVTTYSVGEEFSVFNTSFLLVFLFIMHLILLFFSLRFQFPELMITSGILGVVACFSGVRFVNLIHNLGMKMFFVVYIFICMGLIYIASDTVYLRYKARKEAY